MENWRTIKIASNYEVSNYGNVRNKRTSYILKGRLSKSGYLQVSVNIDAINKQQNQYIHRLVATYWVDNTENKPEVNHKDGNKTNNHYENLEWVTASENQLHRQNILGKNKTSQRKIGKYSKEGILLQEYDSIKLAAEEFHASRVNIDSALQKKQKTAYGFIWKYLD